MEDIAEALKIIEYWNQNYSTKFVMSDYSEAKMLSVGKVFLCNVKVYLCDYIRREHS